MRYHLVHVACPKCKCSSHKPEAELRDSMTCDVPLPSKLEPGICGHTSPLAEWLAEAKEAERRFLKRAPFWQAIGYVNANARYVEERKMREEESCQLKARPRPLSGGIIYEST